MVLSSALSAPPPAAQRRRTSHHNVIDVTFLRLLEYCHPMHGSDLKKSTCARIFVRLDTIGEDYPQRRTMRRQGLLSAVLRVDHIAYTPAGLSDPTGARLEARP